MAVTKKEITKDDIIDMEAYETERKKRKAELVDLKRNRRVEVGPDATWYFENYETMWHQIHEMLWIEKGGEEQIADELSAYNPLIPQGRELVATVMFEIDDPNRRARVLGQIGGIEEQAFMEIDGERATSRPETDVDRTTAEGKASSVQFLHFDLTDAQAEAFKREGTKVVVGFEHPKYSHMTKLSEPVRAALAEDLD